MRDYNWEGLVVAGKGQPVASIPAWQGPGRAGEPVPPAVLTGTGSGRPGIRGLPLGPVLPDIPNLSQSERNGPRPARLPLSPARDPIVRNKPNSPQTGTTVAGAGRAKQSQFVLSRPAGKWFLGKRL